MAEAERTTRLLRRMAEGDSAAAAELYPLVYDELHSIARGFMAGERREHTLQPTALIHEAWMRIQGDERDNPANRSQFVSVAARAMRRVLIDHARKRDAQKRSAGAERIPLDSSLGLPDSEPPDLIELDEALERLEAFDPELVRLVELRFFAGASNAEVAAALGVSSRTVERAWRTAQAWLRAELGRNSARGA